MFSNETAADSQSVRKKRSPTDSLDTDDASDASDASDVHDVDADDVRRKVLGDGKY
jgi:hypothetical protein